MIKILTAEEINKLTEDKLLGVGSSALVFALNNGEAYKEYRKDLLIRGKDLVDWDNYNKGLRNLGHFINLSKISLKSFCSPTGIVLAKDVIDGITMKKAKGEVFKLKDYTLEELLEHESDVREDIIELSKHFEMHDVNESSIYYDPSFGYSLVDLDFYAESSRDNTLNNLFMFYFKILDYIPEVKEKIYEEFSKGLDYYRLEVAIEVINKYLEYYGLEENNIRKIRAMR